MRARNLAWIFTLLNPFIFADKSPAGPVTNPYAVLMPSLTERAQRADLASLVNEQNKVSVELLPISLKDDPLFIGAEQRMVVNAPLAKLEAILFDVEKYNQIFPDIASTRVIKKSPTAWLIGLEQRVPSFFAANEFFELQYDLSGTAGKSRLYIYRLTRGQKLIYSDGFILLKSISPQQTFLLEVDFWKAQLGFGASLVKNSIWRSSLKGFAVSNLALRAAAESLKPLSIDEIKAAIAPALRKMDFGKLVEHKLEATDWAHEFPQTLSEKQYKN